MMKLIIFIFAFIPHPVVMAMARLLQPFFYRIVKRGKWGIRVKKIIPKVFKEENSQWHEIVIRENSLHLLKFAGEMLKARFSPDWRLNKKCYIKEGKQFLDALYKSGTGFTIITCHLGNWEWGAAYIALAYNKTLYAPVFVEDSRGNEVLNWTREGHRVELLEVSRNPRVSARTLLRMIDLVKRGEVVFLVADQVASGGDFRGSLFGADLRIFGGPFIVGKKTHIPFLPMYTLRDKKNRIALYFEKPFYLNGENLNEDIKKVTGFFEKNIGAHPGQYLWSQDRW